MRRALAVILVASSWAVVAFPAAAPARRSQPERLPLPAVFDVLVAPAHGRIFVTGGPGTNKLLVLDLRGDLVKVVRGVPGAGAMVLHRGRLWVLLEGAGALQVIHPARATRGPRYRVGRLPNVFDMAESGGKLWFATGDCDDYTLKSFDLRTAGQHKHRTDMRCPGLAAAPHDRGHLFAWDRGGAPTWVTRLDVDGRKRVVGIDGEWPGEDAEKFEVVGHPDGGTIFTSSLREIERFDVRDLGKTARYPLPNYPAGFALDATARGPMMATTILQHAVVWKVDENPPVAVRALGGRPRTRVPYPRGFALHPSGRRLFVFTGLLTGHTYLHVVRV